MIFSDDRRRQFRSRACTYDVRVNCFRRNIVTRTTVDPAAAPYHGTYPERPAPGMPNELNIRLRRSLGCVEGRRNALRQRRQAFIRGCTPPVFQKWGRVNAVRHKLISNVTHNFLFAVYVVGFNCGANFLSALV